MNTHNMPRFNGLVAVVTCASRSNGAAIARRLAADGATVAVTTDATSARAEQLVREIEATGGRAIAIHADAPESIAVTLAVTQTIETFGRIDFLIRGPALPLEETLAA
jgi:NAD(P)-dependent dehydrogenase (short-subunit alcohol dehydrogenase family)